MKYFYFYFFHFVILGGSKLNKFIIAKEYFVYMLKTLKPHVDLSRALGPQQYCHNISIENKSAIRQSNTVIPSQFSIDQNQMDSFGKKDPELYGNSYLFSGFESTEFNMNPESTSQFGYGLLQPGNDYSYAVEENRYYYPYTGVNLQSPNIFADGQSSTAGQNLYNIDHYQTDSFDANVLGLYGNSNLSSVSGSTYITAIGHDTFNETDHSAYQPYNDFTGIQTQSQYTNVYPTPRTSAGRNISNNISYQFSIGPNPTARQTPDTSSDTPDVPFSPSMFISTPDQYDFNDPNDKSIF